MLVTDKPAFREHLARFALDRLWRLYLDTWQIAVPMLKRAGISNNHSLRDNEMITAIASAGNRLGTSHPCPRVESAPDPFDLTTRPRRGQCPDARSGFGGTVRIPPGEGAQPAVWWPCAPFTKGRSLCLSGLSQAGSALLELMHVPVDGVLG
ncbi:hypothetical protein [Rhodococcus jostii]|uniref:Uncharacterized protein n=1 Tax=Rhodococcus jostii TaxID=132919 RepID=A0A1H4QIK8_RHOJO|nr:hypothetical protein [Rhodococcus jostii]SEC19453.1 hypothetical protein SAMN04490220_1023 [Rhodococcus jostii]